jgi:hypothetical protein
MSALEYFSEILKNTKEFATHTLIGKKDLIFRIVINRHRNFNFYLSIQTELLINEDDENIDILYKSINGKNFLEIATKIVNIINDYKYSPLKSTYIDESDNFNLANLVSNELELFPDIFSKVDDCSVCFSKTFTKTHCNHHLCLMCWEKILSQTIRSGCPLCRKCICMKNALFHENKDECNEF